MSASLDQGRGESSKSEELSPLALGSPCNPALEEAEAAPGRASALHSRGLVAQKAIRCGAGHPLARLKGGPWVGWVLYL